MAEELPSAQQDLHMYTEEFRSFVPQLVTYTEQVVFGDLWERTALSKRDRSLVTVAALIATYRPEQLKKHVARALINGLTREEIAEVVTHLAFYAGWPAAISAAHIAHAVCDAHAAT